MTASFQPSKNVIPDILIVGAGIIGLSVALELYRRGARVVVLERDTALSHASNAAAGMLAAEDPHNPAALLPLSRWSLGLYSDYLARIETLSGLSVPYQTFSTLQYAASGAATQLAERSLDPRQLSLALLAAVRATTIELREHTALLSINESPNGVTVPTSANQTIHAGRLLITTGAWTEQAFGPGNPRLSITPRKGQMLRVHPAQLPLLREAHRSEHVYVLPRTQGPQAGTVIVGATVEDAGFDSTIDPSQLAQLRELAAALHPSLAFVREAQQVEAWAGLRPSTPDGLPLLGALTPRQFVASGHYRNGILLAPATASAMADWLEAKPDMIDLAPFSPLRFALNDAHGNADNRPSPDDNGFRHL